MKNKAFEEAFSDLKLSGEARERILDAALEGGGKAEIRRSAFRPARAALAAALIFCLLTGVTLAASPELRDRLWGDFSGIKQDMEPGGENMAVYDGIEAWIDSALTDGYITVVHVAVRDTQGDRLGSIYNDVVASGGKLYWTDRGALNHCMFYDSGEGVGMSTGYPPEILGFDRDTGTLMLEYRTFNMGFSGGPSQVSVTISTGAFGTERIPIERFPMEDETVIEHGEQFVFADGSGYVVDTTYDFSVDTSMFTSMFNNINSKTGWVLVSDVETLPLREGTVGEASVFLSDIGVTLRGKSSTAGQISITLRDGSEPTAAEGWMADEQLGGVYDEIFRTVSFAKPIPAQEVESLTVGGAAVSFE